MTEVVVRPLGRSDDRSSFACGNLDLDRFFQRFAGQNQFRHHIGTTHIAVEGSRILGFVTVSPGELAVDTLDPEVRKGLPDYPLPILRVSRLAVDAQAQGRGIGKRLLRFSLQLALELRDRFGCVGVVVDAKPDAVAFYRKLGFRPLSALQGTLGDRPVPLPMFLSMRAIVASLSVISGDPLNVRQDPRAPGDLGACPGLGMPDVISARDRSFRQEQQSHSRFSRDPRYDTVPRRSRCEYLPFCCGAPPSPANAWGLYILRDSSVGDWLDGPFGFSDE